MKKRSIIRILIRYLLPAFLFAYSCSQKPRADKALIAGKGADPVASIQDGREMLNSGDLILRTDLDLVSSSLRNFSETDKTYSHCGIAYFEDSAWWVYHLIAGDENPTGIIRKDPFDSFVDPHRKSGFGIFRYLLTPSEASAFSQLIHDDMARQVHFDNLFDLKSDDKLYCAEMVYKALKTATNGRIVLHTTAKNNFRPKYSQYQDKLFKKFEYIALDNLYLGTFCSEIKRYHYPQVTLERGEQ